MWFKNNKIKDNNDNYVPCTICKCVGEPENFFKVTSRHEPFYSVYSVNPGIGYEFYCQKCKPEYDYVDYQGKKPVYYKTIAEHREVIKRIKK